ncbi:transglycosylase [Bradyrhizobium sp. SSBR45G]|uniref:transglycosylase SLT domain-containing protein n=1 Tax=unclassified Bradyrhizobium TaxID=2631580 RepID=UPI002342A5B9|nr:MULTISPECIES: transglycosylase SLT domain-containing protein [unclassified Bradyrhizobium]GLH75187.1 transglycosylase [Bradyrhizobium sp. SSBR45G]GLH83026.1 transglycosylase [Bradyrhizobium sp. SSBR45R]
MAGAAPRWLKLSTGAGLALCIFALANLAYHVVRKPTELFVVTGHALDKEPEETWRQYGALFRESSTRSITPELLAALAQTESSGNPVARTYWRWRLAWNPFALYQPASSAVGLFQMTDGAFADAAPFCIRDHEVVGDGCGSPGLYVRAWPAHAVALTVISLDRQVAAVLARHPAARPTSQQRQDLAAVIHLCGAGPAAGFVRRGFKPEEGERCGDHSVAGYLGKVNTMKRTFKKLSERVE